MKKKRIFWIIAGAILSLLMALWAVFLRPVRPVVPAAERMLTGMEDTRTLVVVYSYSGNTRRVAHATPLSRFLAEMDFSGKQVAPFWTDAGSPGEYESNFRTQVHGGEVLTGLGLSGSSRLSDEGLTQRLEEWLNALQSESTIK